MSSFSESERLRYSRHFVLPGFGTQGQQRLKSSHVVVIGAGGLGAPVLSYLAAAGVGNITVVDDDVVNLSNLQRQILFTVSDVGLSKAKQVVARLGQLNPEVKFHALTMRLNSQNALEILGDAKIVVDATDNFPTRYLINDACVLLGKPLIYGSVFRYEGQVSVFNFNGGPTYRDLYPAPPAPDAVPDCEQGGVLGVLPGLVGALQANEAIKILADVGEPLSGKLLLIDSLSLDFDVLTFPDKQSRRSVKSLIDYDEFCGLNKSNKKKPSMKEVTVQELKQLKDAHADFQLIDVREPHEYELCNLGGELIPQAEIPSNVDKISRDKKVILQCRSGSRSGNMVNWLEKNHGFTNLYNLKGGILAWADQIDSSIPKY